MNPRISVVIPAYNEEKYLARCLVSLQDQTFPKDQYEIVVVDNNSSDRTAEIAREHGVKVVHFAKIQGVSATRQEGIEKARADIVLFTDADITVSKDWIEKIDKIMSDEHILCMGGSVYPRRANGMIVSLFFLYDYALRVHQVFGKMLPWGSNMAVRKEALHAIGGFDLHIPSAEDWDVSMRIQKKFGKKASIYRPDVRVLTETRKQSSPKVFFSYLRNGAVSYWYFIILGKKKLTQMITVR